MGGIESLSTEDSAKLREHANSLKSRYQQKLCKHCASPITFAKYEGVVIPHDLSGEPHWKTCPYSKHSQKKMARALLKKFAVYFSLKHSDVDVESEIGLTELEGKVYHAILEDAIGQAQVLVASDDSQKAELDESKAEVPFVPVPTDPIGDPDEERAPSEELVKELETQGSVEEKFGLKLTIDSKKEVEEVSEPEPNKEE